jgi:hypothetical protein
MPPISVSGHAKPALTTWGAGGVETIAYYRTRTLLKGAQVEGLVVSD